MVIKKLTNKVIDKMILEIKKPENMNKLKEHLVDPLIAHTYKQLYPYFIKIKINPSWARCNRSKGIPPLLPYSCNTKV